MVRGMNLGKTFHPTLRLVCEACMEVNQYAAKLGNDAERQATKSLEIVHLDVYGPMKNMSIKGEFFFFFLLMIFRGMCRFT